MSVTLLVGLLTFVATAGPSALGFVQWKHVQARDEESEYRKRRIESLRAVWEALSEFNRYQRGSIGSPRAEQVDRHLIDINVLIFTSAPFLLTDEQEWAADYVRHLIEIDAILRAASSVPLDTEWWATTATRPVQANHIAVDAANALSAVGQLLAARYAAVVRGDHK